MREKMDSSQPLTKFEFKDIYHPYRDLREINITYSCLKSSIFSKGDVLLSSGSSGSPHSPKKSPSHICIFRPVIIKYSEKPGIQSFQELLDPGFDQEWIKPIFNNRCFASVT
jgi:hypothetical protein